ncbi:MOSC domain-containing protein [Streptomyces sp. NPDC059698]|uniref:MOSC domain-containing protein n=1 Tax=unclassified Streptomyces TaxID=2593676 RepID=UPI00093F87DC|nr:MOSC domain-containing protein [Streptomyces sp. CB02366]OKJ32148.1 molybdenum cofactor biosysynthesis protein [Streptomyces sp. CB02366]TVP37491.1 molybdenum cofactor biosysynthesis protein [Streptomyces griseus subsp. griseus]WSS59189.1 MOSC domain-containing protein [Streptomyces sp. NBC_01178]
MGGQVTAVCRSERYAFSKPTRPSVTLLAGLGVEGDVHAGRTIRHQFRMTYEPDLPNLRQVHLMHEELFAELALKGYDVSAGRLGENITTAGVDLLGLPTGALLRLGAEAVLEVTGLRNPCAKINDFREGLLGEVFSLDPVSGGFTFKAGVMAVVLNGGTVRPGDPVEIELPPLPHRPLERV